MYLKYYEKEDVKYKDINRIFCTPKEAYLAIKKLEKHFDMLDILRIKNIYVEFVSGLNRWSYGSRYHIILNKTRLTWLIVAHEFAHSLLIHLRDIKKEKPGIHHGKQHAKLVEEVVEYMKKKKWIQGSLKEKIRRKNE